MKRAERVLPAAGVPGEREDAPQAPHRIYHVRLLEPEDVEFPGFDGNEETKKLGYTRFFCHDNSPPRYSNLPRRSDDFNSHLPMLGRYRAMLPVFKGLFVPDKVLDGELLAIEQVTKILEAGKARRLNAEL